MPRTLPSPDDLGVATLVTVDAVSHLTDGVQFHVIRPFQLCVGPEQKRERCRRCPAISGHAIEFPWLAAWVVFADLLQVDSSTVPIYWGSHQSLGVGLASDFYLGYGRWYIKPEDFPLDSQTYAIGAGYLLSRPLVRHLAGMSTDHGKALQVPWLPEERLGWLEDAAVGYLLRAAVNGAGRVFASGVRDAWWPLWCEGDFDYQEVIHHIGAAHQFELHQILYSEQGSGIGVCEQLQDFVLKMPKTTAEERITATEWGGSFLGRSLSPILSTMPPPFEARFLANTKEAHMAPFGRDAIVLTGAARNIGRYLLEMLKQGYSRMSGPITVVVLDAVSEPSAEGITTPHEGVKVVWKKVDITNATAVLHALSGYAARIRGVVNLAAVSRVQECHAIPERCREVNVGGTKNIISALWSLFGQGAGATDMYSAAGRAPLPWLIFASSREVYGSLQPGEIADEMSPLRPINIYGETKLEAETAVRRWALKTGFNAIVPRFTNVYGSCHDHESRLIPNFVSKLVSDEKVQIFGSANKTISLLHVQDAVEALLLCMSFAERLDNGAGYFDAFNIGGGPSHDALDIRDVIRMAQSSVAALVPNCKSCSKMPELVESSTTDRSPEPEHFRASTSKAFRVLGFKPSKKFDETTLREYLVACKSLGVSSSASRGTQQLRVRSK